VTKQQLVQLAKLGVPARLQQLRDEMTALLTFGNVPNGERRPRRRMSAAERKAISTRMRTYWAKRRKQQK
jgi:hypothetical protein